ncbi:hypothetical protein [Agarivorans litoreus]|uniref:hypothetical protein n=1 Tax=Agarivorans litoreus TaxID=1510455 RepID=UPI001C7D1A2F|nr:hypothetical protein [Agarivorans litoreus]
MLRRGLGDEICNSGNNLRTNSACSSQATTSRGDNKTEDNQNYNQDLLASIKQSNTNKQGAFLTEEQIDMRQNFGCGGGYK